MSDSNGSERRGDKRPRGDTQDDAFLFVGVHLAVKRSRSRSDRDVTERAVTERRKPPRR